MGQGAHRPFQSVTSLLRALEKVIESGWSGVGFLLLEHLIGAAVLQVWRSGGWARGWGADDPMIDHFTICYIGDDLLGVHKLVDRLER